MGSLWVNLGNVTSENGKVKRSSFSEMVQFEALSKIIISMKCFEPVKGLSSDSGSKAFRDPLRALCT